MTTTSYFILDSTDLSIDVVCAIFFLMAAIYSFYYLYQNHISVQGRIIYLFIIAISVLQVFQTTTQIFTGYTANPRIWDIVNYLIAVFVLMVVHRISIKERLD